MEIIGTIVGREGNVAQVMILRTSACGHDCETCGACAGKEHILLAADEVGYPIGTKVAVEVADEAPLGLAFVVYILPLLLCGGFCVASFLLGQSGWWGLIPGVTIWAVLLYYMNRKKKRSGVDGRVVRREK